MNDRYHELRCERDFRRKVIWRLYPKAKMRVCCGPFWDRTQLSVAMVVLNDSSHGVYVDEELTLLQRAMDVEMRKSVDFPEPDPEHPMVKQNRCFDLIVAAACDDELWEQDFVQDAYHRMMGNEPLDRMAEL